MRYFIAWFGLASATLAAAGAEPVDSPAAAYTRTHRLKAKITLNIRNESVQSVLIAVCDQLEEQKYGKLTVVYGPGASVGQKVTVEARDKPLDTVLDEVFKTTGLGYVVLSKEGERSDGWLKITRGKERGYEPGTEPKELPVPAADPVKEAAATEKLDLAKKYIAEGKPDDARVMLNYVLKKYPDTKAATEAKRLVGTLGK